MTVLVGDIGGTTTRVALVSRDRGPRDFIAEQEYPSRDYPALQPIVQRFLQDHPAKPEYACFAVAGPVIKGQAHLTNLPWQLEEAGLARDLALPGVRLMNDLQAIAHAVPDLAGDEVVTINQGKPSEREPIAILAPGTGLGEAFLIWEGDDYVPIASEGGHADFGATDAVQADFAAFLRQRFGHASYERACAGSGLPNIYDFLKSRDPAAETPGFADALRDAPDRARPILAAALQDANRNPLAVQAVDLLIDIWGAEAGNLALRIVATGGVYLAGGMPPRVVPHLQRGDFMRAFTAKGRFTDILAGIPVKVVMINASLRGAAIYALAHQA